jgi:hypothetical protein
LVGREHFCGGDGISGARDHQKRMRLRGRDTSYDAEAAPAIGAITIATAGGLFTKAALLSAGFEAVAGDLAELSLLLQSRIGTATERNP